MKPDLDAIRARCEAATQGPWRISTHTSRDGTTVVDAITGVSDPQWSDYGEGEGEWYTDRLTLVETDSGVYGPTMPDAQFIANARTDIPALLAYVDDLERDVLNERATFESCNRARMHCERECATLKARTTYTVGETEWAHRIAVAEQRFVDEYDAHQETRTRLTDLYTQQLRADAAQMREYGISYDGVRKLIAECVADEMNVGKIVELLRAAARELAKEELVKLKDEQ